jgi:hypothetical protein
LWNGKLENEKDKKRKERRIRKEKKKYDKIR